MGRWGHRMFEGDQDADIAAKIGSNLMDGNHLEIEAFGWALSMGPPNGEGKDADAGIAAYRQKFDSGIGEKLFLEYRSKEGTKDFFSYEYRTIVLAAMMIHVGAKITQDHIQHIRELLPKIPVREGYQWPICDDGFRGPGQRQFRAALDNYQPGTPRSFDQPSCHACGKVAADIGKPLLRCTGCSVAPGWFCNKDCQKKDWRNHKKSCGPRTSIMMNV
ncbi:hypothetical protein B0T16DRAFT_460228 [Cercophora newfieldiana]|uniref:MYND-type domain-containing protein n=1 Tax=Cercophora newfieldiana TaxID=92897 RepID=A0AA39Y187_9PEZI|nr:hypothetical protein B0T16DRAFT_460228 [Cercophora newfieldiana]